MFSSAAGGPQVRCAAGVVLFLLVPRFLSAQDPVPAPQEPLAPNTLAPPAVGKVTPRRLDFGLSLFEGYDLTDVTDGTPGLIFDRRIRQDASFSALNASLSYSQIGDQKSFGAAAGGDLRYYSLTPTIVPVDFYGGMTFSTRLSRRIGLRGSGNVGYSPYYSFGSFMTPAGSADIRIPDTNQTIVRLETYTAGSSAALSWTLSRRSSLYGGYTLDYVTTPNASYRVLAQGANAGFQRQMTQYLGLRFGYGFRRSQQILETAPHFDVHDIDVGFGYRRPISSSRRTTVAFDGGSALLTSSGTRAFTVTGDASISRQLNRTWTTTASYQRGVAKVGGLLTPFIQDVVSASLGGLWTRHFGFTAGSGYSRGSSALFVHNTYDAIYGTGRLHYDLTRHVPVYVEYVYYHYEFSQTAGLAAGFPLSVQRHGIRAGLGYSIPLVGERTERR